MKAEMSRISRESQETSQGLRAQLDRLRKDLEAERLTAKNQVDQLEQQLRASEVKRLEHQLEIEGLRKGLEAARRPNVSLPEFPRWSIALADKFDICNFNSPQMAFVIDRCLSSRPMIVNLNR
ncbi:hypothetical protein PQX77_013251 [Marasmius sp. AFHP31]|nr:hypothetical protein PQX77_013251 [Marasmius sp. AFHP31]